MSVAATLYLALVVGTIGGWGLWMAYLTARCDRRRGGRPEALRAEDSHHHGMSHAAAD